MNTLVTVETTKTDPTPHKFYPKVRCVFWKRKEGEEKIATGCVSPRSLLRKEDLQILRVYRDIAEHPQL